MKTRGILLGIDLGTMGMKVIAIEAASAKVLAAASAPVENTSPAPGYLEQDPNAWWTTLCQVTRSLLRDLDIASERVVAIGLTGHMHSIVPLRGDGSLAYNCIVWADTRSQAQADQIAATSAERLWNPAIAPYSLAKLLWLREHERAVFDQIDTMLFAKDYLRYRLTGKLASDFSDASGSLMWDFAARQWDTELLAAHDIRLSLLPAVYASDQAAGTLTAAAAAELGLSRRTLVATGGGDAACAVVGANIRDGDSLMINTGTAVQVIEMQAAPTPFHPRTAMRYLFELGVDGATFAIGALNSAGHSLNWWRQTLDPAMTHEDFEALAAPEPTPVDGPLFLPWLQGTGTPFLLDGPYGSFVQLSATADQASLTRAVMEGVAFGIRLCAEALVGANALPAKRIVITGGLPKSPLMRQLLSHILPSQVTFLDFTDMSALGAAAHGAVAAGLYADAGAFLAQFDYGETSPDARPELQAHYEAVYARFQQWAQRIAGS